jgi:hypothetical protein
MRRVIFPSVVYLALLHLTTLFHKRQDFPKENLLNIKCVFLLSLQLLPETVLILRRIQ